MCPHCVWIITVGGDRIGRQFYDDVGLIKDHNVVMLTEFYNLFLISFQEQWRVDSR